MGHAFHVTNPTNSTSKRKRCCSFLLPSAVPCPYSWVTFSFFRSPSRLDQPVAFGNCGRAHESYRCSDERDRSRGRGCLREGPVRDTEHEHGSEATTTEAAGRTRVVRASTEDATASTMESAECPPGQGAFCDALCER